MTKQTATLTPYAASKMVSAKLAEAGFDKTVSPQMVYNYTTARFNKGKAPLIQTSADGKRVNEDSLLEWLGRYIEKQNAKAQASE